MLATAADVPFIRELMQQAGDYKQTQGDDIWGDEPFTDDEVSRILERGGLFTYKVDGDIAACVVLQETDERMWNEAGKDNTALYIHRLCVGDSYRGMGVGEAVVDLAAEQARIKGKTKLRLDCPHDVPGLVGVYQRLGFEIVEQRDIPASPGRRNPDKTVYKAALFERAVA